MQILSQTKTKMRNPKVSKKKVFDVVNSCKTYDQVRSAIKYAILAGMRQEPIIDEIIEFKLMTTNPNI